MNYAVPDFGADPEITASQVNLANTEKRMKHKINMRTNKDVLAEWGRIRYGPHVPQLNLGQDQDITNTQNSIKQA